MTTNLPGKHRLEETETILEETYKPERPLRVLLLHSDKTVAAACQPILENESHTLTIAEDGVAGIQQAYQLIPDIILTASTLPGFNGYQVCRLLKNDGALKRIPIILIADNHPNLDRFWAMKSGVDDFLIAENIIESLIPVVYSAVQVYGLMSEHEKQAIIALNQENPFNVRVRLNQILDQSLMESILMTEFRSFADLVHNSSILNYMVFSFLESVIDYDAAAIFYNDYGSTPKLLSFHFAKGNQLTQNVVTALEDAFYKGLEKNTTFNHNSLKETELVGELYDDTAAHPQPEEKVIQQPFGHTYQRNFEINKELIGSLVLYSTQAVDYGNIFPVKLIEQEFHLLMKLRHLFSKAESLATIDALTGIYNHSHFMVLLQREFKVAKRYATPLSLVLLDMPDFTNLNSEWGHACGDAILKFVVTHIRNALRSSDIFGRFTSKKMIILMPQTSAKNALVSINRIQQDFTTTPFTWEQHTLKLRFIGGIAELSQTTVSAPQFVNAVERALNTARGDYPDNIVIAPH
ncbi:MAG: diguanylate cyclase [Cyanobacteria bacterium P01_H01_bin.74]